MKCDYCSKLVSRKELVPHQKLCIGECAKQLDVLINIFGLDVVKELGSKEDTEFSLNGDATFKANIVVNIRTSLLKIIQKK